MPAEPSTSSSPAFQFEVYDRPGLELPPRRRSQLVRELRECAAQCLDPLPDYQCLSHSPKALDDKVIVVCRVHDQLVAFVSAVYLTIPPPPLDNATSPFDNAEEPTTILHTGLTCVLPSLRRAGLVKLLFVHLFMHLSAQPEHTRGLWVTSLAEVPGSLGAIQTYGTRVFPAPGAPSPSRVHLRIADAVSTHFRDAMLISRDAVFDRQTFVFRGSNPPGSCFRKDSEDERYHYRDGDVNAFYVRLLGRNEGNEVLQVGFMDWEHVFNTFDRVKAGYRRNARKERAKL